MNVSELVAPLESEVFFEHYWQKKHLAIHESLQRFIEPVRRISAQPIHDLVSQAGQDVSVWFNDREGRYSAITVSPAAALPLYETGMTLYFSCADAQLQHWIRAIEACLGRKPGTGVVSLFASRTGDHVATHFDQNENFTIQLRGTKRWHLSAHQAPAAPIEPWVIGTPVPDWLCRTAFHGIDRSIPQSAPGQSESIDLHPGSLLYVPAGMWHATETLEDSLSLNLNLTRGNASWIDVLSEAWREVLANDRQLRGCASGAWGSERPAQVHQELDRMLDRARALLANVRARDLWGPPLDEDQDEEPGQLVRRNPLAHLVATKPPAADGAVPITVGRFGADETLEILVPRALVPLTRWVSQREGIFMVGDALQVAAVADRDNARVLIENLVSIGYLTCEQ